MEAATLSSYLYVPRSSVQPEHFDAFSYSVYDSYAGETRAIETFDLDEDLHSYRFPRGDLGKLRRVFGLDLGLIDNRCSVPFTQRLKFTGKLTDEQRDTLKQWITYGYGMLQAPPRWGKTVWMTALMTKLRQRTLMIAHLEDLCHQLEDTVRTFTNVNELEEEAGCKLIGVLNDWSRQEPFPIMTLSTYQRFAVSKKGRVVIDKWKNKLGLVMVDEAHRAKTDLYVEVVGRLNAAYRCGVTATPERKDKLHVIVHDVLGPVTAVGIGEQLGVDWSWEYTGYEVPQFSSWGVMWNRMAKAKTRTKKIAKKVVEDAKDHFVLVTTDRIKHMNDLKDYIEKLDPEITIGLLHGNTYGRDQFRKDCKVGKYQIVIAMNRIVELGYNIPRWSCFHNTMPMTNAPNWYQRISRIRTPMEPAFDGDDYVKPDPVARVWADTGHKAVWAYKNVVRKENEKRGFICLNTEPKKKKGKRQGLALFVEDSDG